MKLTNAWNRFIYAAWSPVYDRLFDQHLFRKGRQRSLELLGLTAGESVILVGVGTGADLPLLPAGVRALGIDLSPSMLEQARRKLPLPGREIELRPGDAQALNVESATFDAAVLHLVLSVVPDGAACFREAMRVLKPGGRAVIFDKFLPEGGSLSVTRRAANLITTLAGTDVTRRLSDLLAGSGARVVHQEPSVMGGVYSVVRVEKPASPA